MMLSFRTNKSTYRRCKRTTQCYTVWKMYSGNNVASTFRKGSFRIFIALKTYCRVDHAKIGLQRNFYFLSLRETLDKERMKKGISKILVTFVPPFSFLFLCLNPPLEGCCQSLALSPGRPKCPSAPLPSSATAKEQLREEEQDLEEREKRKFSLFSSRAHAQSANPEKSCLLPEPNADAHTVLPYVQFNFNATVTQ